MNKGNLEYKRGGETIFLKNLLRKRFSFVQKSSKSDFIYHVVNGRTHGRTDKREFKRPRILPPQRVDEIKHKVQGLMSWFRLSWPFWGYFSKLCFLNQYLSKISKKICLEVEYVNLPLKQRFSIILLYSKHEQYLILYNNIILSHCIIFSTWYKRSSQYVFTVQIINEITKDNLLIAPENNRK